MELVLELTSKTIPARQSEGCNLYVAWKLQAIRWMPAIMNMALSACLLQLIGRRIGV